MINAISEVFVGISRYNCYFHYKKNIVDKLRKKGFLKKKNKDETFKEVKEIINILGRLLLDYDGNMEYFNSITEDIKKRYPYINDFIDNYFIKYKKIHFENEAYNYNKIPVGICDIIPPIKDYYPTLSFFSSHYIIHTFYHILLIFFIPHFHFK